MRKCDYCSGNKKYMTPHQAGDNSYSKSFVTGDTLVTQAFIHDKCTSEINVDIAFCPFCGKKVKSN